MVTYHDLDLAEILKMSNGDFVTVMGLPTNTCLVVRLKLHAVGTLAVGGVVEANEAQVGTAAVVLTTGVDG